ncbi:5-deoxy-glucuronate isomerase [Micrococcus yunnanensis]|uniref:5-deoxy-glucuronate isomerase n=1 Tax=Micrococcus TaxID=1269 RepID=UPI0008A1FAE6|nr:MULTISPECIES: 5-deoxy-glucuronate isomerase [Micrococcus]MBF0745051.1 5-deoxy-glucuronate isomerase [Micrococcus yunnanensis]OFS13319.1 5-deoxy-glucuronate isomerase [Micrococcus sp. HMSC31B01]TFU54886.1 5-deoxy-glucuronate isomerase [Micrococcus yunnanensis]
MNDLHLPAGSTARGAFDTVVDPGARQDWVHTGLRVLALAPGQSEAWTAEGVEAMVVPLQGACTVDVETGDGVEGAGRYALRGRPDVFAGPTDVLYAPVGSRLTVTSESGGRFALALAVADAAHPVALIRVEDIPVETRGGGAMTRQVRNFGTVGSFDACDSLIACEVITPGGHWSSYPAHKHDETVDDPEHPESELEEIYYYEIAPSPTGGPGFGYHQTTSADPARPLDILAEVRAGDVVLVPHGWHGPCAAAPGHDMYYLNVMAGPAPERAWHITDHPDQTWVRGTW